MDAEPFMPFGTHNFEHHLPQTYSASPPPVLHLSSLLLEDSSLIVSAGVDRMEPVTIKYLKHFPSVFSQAKVFVFLSNQLL